MRRLLILATVFAVGLCAQPTTEQHAVYRSGKISWDPEAKVFTFEGVMLLGQDVDKMSEQAKEAPLKKFVIDCEALTITVDGEKGAISEKGAQDIIKVFQTLIRYSGQWAIGWQEGQDEQQNRQKPPEKKPQRLIAVPIVAKK